jgi:hypothetical protein
MCIYVNSTYVSSRWISLDPVHVGRRSARVFFYFKKKCYNNRFAEVSLLINAVKNSIACRFVASGQHNRNG